MGTSKSLSKEDLSGTYLFEQFFPDEAQYLKIDIDRIQTFYDAKKNSYSWVLFIHLPMTDEQEISQKIDPSHLSNFQKEELEKSIQFLSFFQEKIKGKKIDSCQMIWTLYPKQISSESHVFSAHIQSNQTKLIHLKNLHISQFSTFFRKLNEYGSDDYAQPSHHIKRTHHHFKIDLLEHKKVNSSFSFSQIMLNGDMTYGFNPDALLFDPKHNKCFIFEFLLCSKDQKIGPYQSHPNRYFYKNKKKFINLFDFSQAIESPLYLINYSEKDHFGSDDVLWMHCQNVEPMNQYSPVKTHNTKTKLSELNILVSELLNLNQHLNEQTSQFTKKFKI